MDVFVAHASNRRSTVAGASSPKKLPRPASLLAAPTAIRNAVNTDEASSKGGSPDALELSKPCPHDYVN